MTPDEAVANVEKAFGHVARPRRFIRGTCLCQECLEHDRTLAAHTPATITLAELGNPGWDPVCFASDQAFAYYLPAMIRLAFEPDYYVDQLLFHLNMPGRSDFLDSKQAKVLLDALWALFEAKGDRIAECLDEHDLEQALRRLERPDPAPDRDARVP